LDFQRTDVDGVPTLWAPAGGELRAGLVFRVGRADEILARGGLTHLVEHLVLQQVEQPSLHINGATGATTTMFYAHGDGEDVVDFFAGVCRGLREPPMDRMTTEIGVLRTEADGQVSGGTLPLLAWRYGAATYGLPAFTEFGLDDLTTADVHGWIERWFTRDNAVLWVAGGPPPAGLRLDLLAGAPLPPPAPSSALPRTPAFFNANVNGVAFDAVLPRSVTGSLYAQVLDRQLHRRLRRELGVSYATQAVYQARDARYATVTAFADALPDRHADVTREFVDVLIDLAAGGVSEDALAAARSIAQRRLRAGEVVPGWLASNAERLLLGLPTQPVDEVAQALTAIGVAEVVSVAGQALDAALAMVPHGRAIGRAGFVAAPTGSANAVTGESYRPRNDPDTKRRLVLGVDGVSLVEELSVATVRYAECAAMLAWPDGGRVLFAADAVMVRVEPGLWEVPPARLAVLDTAVLADRTVHMPARLDKYIPKPPEPPAPAATASQASPVRNVRLTAIAVARTVLWLTVAALIVVYVRPLSFALAVTTGLLLVGIRRRAAARRRAR
jgi:predicted Zn-dependent peptidase